MAEQWKPGTAREYDMNEGLALAVSYLEDPSGVSCPRCGAGTIEVVCYLDGHSLQRGRMVTTPPHDDYTVVLYCHGCGRAAALDLSRDARGRDGEEDQRRDVA